MNATSFLCRHCGRCAEAHEPAAMSDSDAACRTKANLGLDMLCNPTDFCSHSFAPRVEQPLEDLLATLRRLRDDAKQHVVDTTVAIRQLEKILEE